MSDNSIRRAVELNRTDPSEGTDSGVAKISAAVSSAPLAVKAAVAAAIAIGVLMISLAVPRLLAAVPAEAAADVLARINHGADVSVDEIEQGILDVDDAIARTPEHGELYIRRATLRQHRLAMLEVDLGIEMTKIRDDAVKAVTYSPGDPYSWYMLAFSEQALHGEMTDQAQRALRASILLGRSESQLIIPRITFGINYWDQLDDELKALVHTQISIALRHWHLIRPLGAYLAGVNDAQAAYIMKIITSTPNAYQKGIQRVKNMKKLYAACAEDKTYSSECADL